jgi:hypothetical protein
MRTVVACGALAVVALSGATVPAEAAAPAVRLMYVQYNAKGADTRKNLNREFVVVKNYGKKTVNIGGWTLGDPARPDSANTFYFPGEGFWLKPGKYVIIRTGAGSATGRTLYYGYVRHIWNNTRGTAALFNIKDKKVDSCSWNGGKGLAKC